ncbi:hypothetical protein HII36_05160 [Nonomuraea sp. NN258]|uniref:hypothetical protein n=1 Tax=Nonomuraea antri TaxID=2730852 RepID=UPI00156A0372|nr:hypothetical protein [Nonomuraea antri]NRQ31225.1 hypothetical protein [Nonomuraea antri]
MAPDAIALEGVVLGPDEPHALVRDGVLVCPHPDCGAVDQIVELDVATRSNELEIVGPGAIAAYCGDSTFEGDGFECDVCSRRVSLPDDFEIVSWD